MIPNKVLNRIIRIYFMSLLFILFVGTINWYVGDIMFFRVCFGIIPFIVFFITVRSFGK